MRVDMKWLLLLLYLLLISICQIAAVFSGSGSGYDRMMPVDNGVEAKKSRLARICSVTPEICQQSPLVCPCGSIYDHLSGDPFTFYIFQIFPCEPVNQHKATFRDCDAFIQYGATLAGSLLHKYKELEYLYLFCFSLFNIVNQPDDIANSVHDFMNTIRSDRNVFGVLGPTDPDVLEILPYIAGNAFQKITVSYSTSRVTTQNPDKYNYLFSTVPSPSFFNKVILELLSDFKWRRVAIISTRDPVNLGNSEHLLKLGSLNSSFEFSFLNAYDNDPTSILEQFQKDDFRIFVANVESSKARDLFCIAKTLNLTTERHQWILPSFYNHKWWSANCTDKQDCLCTNDEILDASLGTIFVGESNTEFANTSRMTTAFQILKDIFQFTIEIGLYDAVDKEEDDELFLLHSKALYVYDAMHLFAIVFNDAMRELFNTSQTNQEREYLCDAIIASNVPFTSNILTAKILEILNRSVFCGYSGYYVLANSSSFGQAWITQFQYYENCSQDIDLGNFKDTETDGCYKESSIGHYSNFDQPKECEYFKLINIDELANSSLSGVFHFSNASCEGGCDQRLISTRPYLWKGDNPWQSPVDGACYDDSCICLNQLGRAEIIVGIIITTTGILLCCALLIVNCQLRNNKHIKASSPRLNSIIIIGCIMLYLIPVFRAVSLSGNLLLDSQNLIPSSCEVIKWLNDIGFTVILATLVARNWRIYRIFFNPKIKERKYLSDIVIFILTIIMIIPVVLTVILWTVTDNYKYTEFLDLFNCPDLDVDDSIATFKLTIRCTSDNFSIWKGSIIAYQSLLGAVVLFLGYQNSTIFSHFAQEGEFASKTMFIISLIMLPSTFLVMVIINETTSRNSLLIFWITCAYLTVFPTIILLGLYIPKFILIIQDKRTEKERRTTKVQWSLQAEYESKINEIGDLRLRLRSVISKQSSFDHAFGTIDHRNSSIADTQSSYIEDYQSSYTCNTDHKTITDHRGSSTITDPQSSFTIAVPWSSSINSGTVRFSDVRKSPSPSPLATCMYKQKKFFNNDT